MTYDHTRLTYAIGRAIYEARNGHSATPWKELPQAHRNEYVKDGKAAIRAIYDLRFVIAHSDKLPKEPSP